MKRTMCVCVIVALCMLSFVSCVAEPEAKPETEKIVQDVSSTIEALVKPDEIIYYGEQTRTYQKGSEEYEQVFSLNQARQNGNLDLILSALELPEEIQEGMPVEMENGERFLLYRYTTTNYAPVLFSLSVDPKEGNMVCVIDDEANGPYGMLAMPDELLAYIKKTL